MSTKQYTIRNIPEHVDQVIKKQALRSGKSFNQTVVDILTVQAFGTNKPKIDSNYGWLFNQNTLDDSFDQAIDELSKPDKDLWL